MFKRFMIAIVLAMALMLVAGITRAEFNVDGILSPAEQEAVMRDIKLAMQQAPEIYKADIYPEGIIVIYYDDDGGKADGTCDNAILFQIGAILENPENGMLVPMVIPMMQIPTCKNAEDVSEEYFKEKGFAPNSVARPDSPEIEKMQFNQTGELTPDEYQKLVIFWNDIKKNYPKVVKVYVHELLGVALVFIDSDKNGAADYVDHVYFSGFDEDGVPVYLRVSISSVEEAESMYKGYLEHMKTYRRNHSV